MKAFLDHSHVEAKNIISFWFRPERQPDFNAGQFIEMHLPHPKPDDRGQNRWFTLSSSPTDLPLVSITTKFAAGRSSTFKSALRELKPGDNVEISDPMGDFVLPKDKGIPLVFVAGGIGITPFHSIVKFLHDENEKRDIQFVYALRDKSEQVFDKLLSSYPLKQYSVVFQEGHLDQSHETGNLSAKRILKLTGKVGDKLIYISGPEVMVEAFYKDLQSLGVPKSQLVGDYFPNYSTL